MRIIRFDSKGWRARFDDGFDEESVRRAVDAFGYIWSEARPGSKVYVGYDTRFGGRRFASVAAEALSGRGLRARVSDMPCPIPALGWAVAHDVEAIGAVYVGASSAPAEYGGVSARADDGGPVGEDFYEAATQVVSSTPSDAHGKFSYADLMGPYLDGLKSFVDVDAIADAAPQIVVDPLHGASQGCLAGLLKSIGCRVHEIHGELVPDFGGLRPMPAKPWVDTCGQAVQAYQADIGFVLDGDGDRLGVLDGKGRFVTPHRMAPLIMDHLVTNRHEEGRVVATLSSSAYIRKQAKRLGLSYTAVPTGFTRIYREFVEGDVLLGAEEYGGVAVPAHLAERDGLLAALLMVEHIAMSGLDVSEQVDALERDLGKLYYVRRDIQLDVASVQAFRNILPGLYLPEVCGMEPVSVGHSDGLVLRFDDDSWVQLRPSRTEALVRSCAEAPDLRVAEKLAQAACEGALDRLPGALL